jgi:peptidoglycan/LPS O-acetylase OafA/YrhL
VFWSLSYEVWYYVAFAVAFYLRGSLRAVLLPAVLVLLGIPVLIYFPIWLVGVLIYWLHKRTRISRRWATMLAIASALAIVAIRIFGFDDRMDNAVDDALGGWPFQHLNNSMHFSTHYLVGILVALNIYAVRYCDLGALEKPGVRRPIVYAASFTFALYLAHRPLMNFWAFAIGLNPHSVISVAALFVLVIVSVWAFGYVSEHRKNEWRALFRAIFRRSGIGLGRPAATI